jgi:hypothetical protein
MTVRVKITHGALVSAFYRCLTGTIRARSDDSDDLDSAVARLRKSGIKAI